MGSDEALGIGLSGKIYDDKRSTNYAMERFKTIESLADHIKEYVNSRIAMLKLQLAEKTSKIISSLITGTLLLFVLLFFVVFLSLAAAHAIGNALGHLWTGFLIVSALFLVAGIVLYAARESLFRIPIMNSIIRQLFDEKEQQDEKDQKP